MRIFRLARTPPQWLRVALASLMLAFALNSIAYVTHRHEMPAGHALHSLQCGFCVSFDNITPAPAISSLAVGSAPAIEIAPLSPAVVVSHCARTSAQPRAPPTLV